MSADLQVNATRLPVMAMSGLANGDLDVDHKSNFPWASNCEEGLSCFAIKDKNRFHLTQR